MWEDWLVDDKDSWFMLTPPALSMGCTCPCPVHASSMVLITKEEDVGNAMELAANQVTTRRAGI